MSLQTVLELALNGAAYGAVLFLISSGMSITMGLMRFANLAHGVSVMFGGFTVVALMAAGWPFLLTLPVVFVLSMVGGGLSERALLHLFYERSEANQVLVTIGIVFVAISVATYVWGAGQQAVTMPTWLDGRVDLGIASIGAYRLFSTVAGLVVAAVLIFAVETSFIGAQIRAAVDDRAMAESCGVNVGRLFTLVFALSAGVAGLGGALSINILGLDSSFPLRFLVVILIVVTVGGAGSIRAVLAASLLLGMIDSLTKYYVASAGAFALYVVAALVLLVRPGGLFRRPA